MSKKQSTINKPKPAPAKRKPTPKNSIVGEQSWIKYALVLVIVTITYISFSPALKGNFMNWDEQRYILDNSMLSKPLNECAKYFFSNFFFSNYHPLTMIAYAMEFQHSKPIQGLPANPNIFHEVNLIIHLLNVMLVFWFRSEEHTSELQSL